MWLFVLKINYYLEAYFIENMQKIIKEIEMITLVLMKIMGIIQMKFIKSQINLQIISIKTNMGIMKKMNMYNKI